MRMRKSILLVLLLFFLVLDTGSAAQIRGWLNYQPWLDMYRFDYTYPTGSVRYRVWFISASGLIYESHWNFVPTMSHYLTCNGNYNFDFYDANDQLIGYFRNLITTQIQRPACLSYPQASGHNDFQLFAQASTTPGYSDVSWNTVPGAAYYEVYADGQLVDTTTGTSGQYPNGPITIVARDSNGDIIGQSDGFVPDGYNSSSPSTTTGEGDDTESGPINPPPSTCSVCDKIAAALQCPEWDTYMGELTQAIRDALPTLPEWRQIANQFIYALDDYLGPVPMPPSISQIESNIRPDMPSLDTSVPGSDMTPILPAEYDTPLHFDVTDTPEIPVLDESEPFEIYEPDRFINADDPGEFVYPGDPANHSDGIKNPDIVDTGNNTPGPTGGPTSPPPVDPPIPEPPDDPEIPPSDMPEPSPTDPDMALPTK